MSTEKKFSVITSGTQRLQDPEEAAEWSQMPEVSIESLEGPYVGPRIPMGTMSVEIDHFLDEMCEYM